MGLAALAVDEGHLVEVRTFEHNDYYFKQAIRTYHIEELILPTTISAEGRTLPSLAQLNALSAAN